ncbi:leucine-rich repeat protein [Perkinsela sp. CCAP 1560/4]|nr:leucine-rich repeat protein [Perkinsela sp. CCAP 1560/4]|eukprot:KNH07988.1 leucine-rich repeat protein [Perkinsela sp. CCAP 1560/4]
MYAVLFALCDDRIGEVDRSKLTQQALMKCFISGLDKADDICGPCDIPVEVCEWKGVTCNADKKVEEFWWSRQWRDGTGTLNFAFLPSSAKNLYMYSNALSGSIKLACLPAKMEDLRLIENQLTGSLELDMLPATMKIVRLGTNKFSGTISLVHLPRALTCLSLFGNLLSGTVCLTSLPPSLEELSLSSNNFEGSLDFTKLPHRIAKIYLFRNMFAGTIDLRHLPETLHELDARHNRLTGAVRVPQEGHFELQGNDKLTLLKSVVELHDKYQTSCMRRTVGKEIINARVDAQSVDPSEPNCCIWAGVACRNRRIISIKWDASTNANIYGLEWLPVSLERAQITGKPICTTLKTRLLPRSLRFVYLERCGLHGQLDLRALPDMLEELHVPQNNFSGDVWLTSLPPDMRVVNLERNEVKRAYVCNERLSLPLRRVQLYSPQCPQVVCFDGERAVPRILTEPYLRGEV